MYIPIKKYLKQNHVRGGGPNRGSYGSIIDAKDFLGTVKVFYVDKSTIASNTCDFFLYTKDISISDLLNDPNLSKCVVKIPTEGLIDNNELYGAVFLAHKIAIENWNTTQFLPITTLAGTLDVFRINNSRSNMDYINRLTRDKKNSNPASSFVPVAILSQDKKTMFPIYFKCTPLQKGEDKLDLSKNSLTKFIENLHDMGHAFNDIKHDNIVKRCNNFVFCDYGSIKPFSMFLNYYDCNLVNLGSTLPSPWVVMQSDARSLQHLFTSCTRGANNYYNFESLTENQLKQKSSQLFKSYYNAFFQDVGTDNYWDSVYKSWQCQWNKLIVTQLGEGYNITPPEVIKHIMISNDYFGLGLIFTEQKHIQSPFKKQQPQPPPQPPPQESTNNENSLLCYESIPLDSPQGGAAKYMTILGRKRKLVRKGRSWMLNYKGNMINLTEARKLERLLRH